MSPFFRQLLCLVGSCFAVCGQDQATTLLHAVQRADAIVRATVVEATDPSPDWHRLTFRTDEVLSGRMGSQFQVLEPAGACCGRSLFALRPADRCLLFLRREGPTLHPLFGARGVLPDDAALRTHVLRLLAAREGAARAQVLVDGLQSSLPRIADDAAHALAVLPSLVLGATAREIVVRELVAAVTTAHTRSAALVDVAVRLADAPMLDAVLPLYLDQDRNDLATLLRQGLLRCSADDVVSRTPMHIQHKPHRELRAAELFGELPVDLARPAIVGLLATTTNPRVQLCLVERLIDSGTNPATLRDRAPAVVLDLAERRVNTARSFRSIRPHSR